MITTFGALFVAPTAAYAAGGSYSINWSAADPTPNKGPYAPTYTKVSPSQLACPTPTGGAGRAADPMGNAVFGNPKDAVESLAPPDMALGQIVPFEVKIAVSGSTTPENGVIDISPYWLTKTTSGGDFGYDPAYKLYCAFVDTADSATVDPGSNAKVTSYSSAVAGTGTSNEQIQGTIRVSGLDNGDSVVLELWVVLKSTIPAGSSGNVQTGLISAKTAAGDTINTGNQTVPLLRVQEFFTSDVDVSVTKSDSPDPVSPGGTLTYTLTVAASSSYSAIANGIVVTDTLDANTTYLSASGATCSAAGQAVTCNVGALSPGTSTAITINTTVSATAPTLGTTRTGTCTAGQTGVDLCNVVSVTTISDDVVAGNNSDSEPTDVSGTATLSLTKSATPTIYKYADVPISYSYVLKNTGNVPLSAPYSVTDDKATVTCPSTPTTLAPSGTVTCTATYSTTAADVSAGSVTNKATASAYYGTTAVSSNEATATITYVAPDAPALSLTKAASPATYGTAGDSVSYTYTLKNDGNVALSAPYAVSDDKATVTCPSTPATLAVGGTVTCTATYTITQADLDAGSVTNRATATATFGTGTVTSNEATATVTADQAPALSLTKAADPATYDAVDQTITYSYVIKNTGNVTLSGPFSVSDDKATVTCTQPSDGNLSPDETTSCSASYAITQTDLDAGHVTNVATATNGTVTTDQATATVNAVQSRALSLDKTAAEASYATAGDVLHYSYLVTNSGNVTLHDAITVSDDKATDESCPALPLGGLAPGASVTCTATYAVTQADVDAGSVTNVATAASGTTTSNEDTVKVPASQGPVLTLQKSAAPATYDTLGQTITYSYVLKNSGNVTLSGPFTVSDDKATVTCDEASSLAVGATLSCSATYAVTQADLDAGAVTNVATGHASFNDGAVDSNEADATVTATQLPGLMLDKTATPGTYSKVGDVISYTYVVTNSGNVTLFDVSVVDDKATVSCPDTSKGLAPFGAIACTATYLIGQADLDYGSVTNTAYATDGTTQSATDSETVDAEQNLALTIDKTASPATYSSVGDVISYSYLVTNSGNVTLFNIGVTDNRATVTCPDTSTGLAPGAQITCAASYTISQADLDAGSVTNTAYAKAGTTESEPDSETVTAQQAPVLTLVKEATPHFSDPVKVGDTIDYTLTAKNTGNVTLTNVSITDAMLSSLTCTPAQPATLAPGATLVCTGTHALTQADIDAGKVSNVAIADSDQTPPTETPNDVPVPQEPALTVVKTATPSTYKAVGDVISYSYLVTNSGNVTLFGISVVDDKATVACPDTGTGLAPGAQITCTASYTIAQVDLDAGSVTNNAYATDGATTSPPDSETVTADQTPALTLVKAAAPHFSDPAQVGDTIDYTLTAKNTGNVTLTNVSISDPMLPSLTCTPGQPATLAPLATLVCTGTYALTQADIDAGMVSNVATATSDQTPPTETPNNVPVPQKLALAIDKTASPDTYSKVGDVISYSYLVTNTGNVTLFNISVLDDKATVACPDTSAGVAPDAQITCNASYTVGQKDLDAGSVTNTAYAKAGTTESAKDSETVTADQTPKLSLTKTAAPTTYSEVGTSISYSYVLKNTGNVTLSGPFAVTDNKATVTCPATPTSLAPNATVTCTASYTVTQADLDAGSVTNTATATASFGGRAVTSNEASATVTANQLPAISLSKTADPNTYIKPGDVIGYTLVAKNTGNVTLSAVSISDPTLGTLTCTQPVTLAPNATLTCTGSYTIQAGDLTANYTGKVVNTATVTSTLPGGGTGPSATASATVNQISPLHGQVLPTQTTCQMYQTGTMASLTQLDYNAKGTTITSVAPGVIFYYMEIKGTGGTQTISVNQSNGLGWRDMQVQQVVLWDASCTKVADGTSSGGTASVTASTTAGALYYLSVKYSPSSLAGQKVSRPYPTDTYTFSALSNGSAVDRSKASIDVVPKK